MRVRALVSPSCRPTYGEPAGMAICSVSRPAACSRSPASWPSISDAPRMSASASASSSVSGIDGVARVGVVGVVEDQVAAAVAV